MYRAKSKEDFGPKQAWDYDGRTDQLFEWVTNIGEGVMRLNEQKHGFECFNFCLNQYDRFRIPLAPAVDEAIREGITSTFTYVDYIDPYSLFWGIGDINLTDDWSVYAYEIKDGRNYIEVDPETVETFAFMPGQAEENFDFMMSHPGLKAVPAHAADGIIEVLEGEWYGDERCRDRVDAEVRRALEDLCRTPEGHVNYTALDAYFELAAWASFAWIAGPLSRQLRAELSDIYSVALRYGECIMVDGCVIPPSDYRRLSRPPQSCYKCGISSWCTELVMTFGSTRYICEHCLSEGMPPMGRATCGSKMCMLTRCPHHPFHSMGAAGLARSYREHGQLIGKARGASDLGLLSTDSRKLLNG